MPHPIHPPDQLDGAWQCALDCLLGACLTLCFPATAAMLDLSRPLTVLESELAKRGAQRASARYWPT
jgi:hypothetical protein